MPRRLGRTACLGTRPTSRSWVDRSTRVCIVSRVTSCVYPVPLSRPYVSDPATQQTHNFAAMTTVSIYLPQTSHITRHK
eukprot:SAG25_NODE_4088_length_892_cov_8.283733_2_plen_78_part_01